MADADKFDAEIAALVDKWSGASRDLVPSFLTKALIDNHIGGLARANEHTPFFEHYTYKGVRHDVGKYLLKKYGEPEKGNKEQGSLPGFEYLQRYYIIRRADQDVPVLYSEVSNEEFTAKARMLRRRGKACYAHADEIERFVQLRQKDTAAA